MINRLKAVLLSIKLFSALIIQLPLHPYQLGPANAVIDSCLHSRGLEFLWVFPRQSGKDETIAQLVVFLLVLFHRLDACIVHVYPTQQQIATGAARLQRRLTNPITAATRWYKADPIRMGFGGAACAFFSGHPQSRAEGATANLLLIVNEAQDQDEAIVERRFTPMRASTNATALYVGTVRTTSDYLWRIKQRLERLQEADGIRRVFIVSADQVGEANPHYRDFVDGQVRLKGRQHPTVKTELFNEPLDVAAGLFPPRRIALMQGTHQRARTPAEGVRYVATLDVAGQDEATTEGMFSDLVNPARDYTVCTIFQIVTRDRDRGRVEGREAPSPSPSLSLSPLPVYHAVDVFVDHGSRHFQDAPGAPPLFARLLAYLNLWQPMALISDASGVGQGLTDALIKAWPRQVIPFDFAHSHNKAQLGNDFIALIETGRFKYFRDGDSDSDRDRDRDTSAPTRLPIPISIPIPIPLPISHDAWWFFEQCRFCGYELAEGLPIERGLRWGVPAQATTSAPDGATAHVHDDRLLSAALIAEADRQYRAGAIFIGATESHVITVPSLERLPRPGRGQRQAQHQHPKEDTWS